MPRPALSPSLFPLALLGAVACGSTGNPERPAGPEPRIAALEPESVLAVVGGTDVVLGGFGSAAATDPRDPTRVFLLTDRGPNFDAPNGAKVFAAPGFTPEIAVIRWPTGTTARIERVIPLRAADGTPLSGLPADSDGGVSETAVDLDGAVLPNDGSGVDSEGLHVTLDGSLWIAEEYRPSILALDSTGRLRQRLYPGRGLPKVLGRRRPNRGFEGLTGDPTGRILVAVLQGPLDNPAALGRSSSVVRVLRLDTASGETSQFLVHLDDPGDLLSDLAWVDERSILVIEHDGAFKDGDPPAARKRVYRLSFDGATEVSDTSDSSEGRLVGGKTLEALSPAELERAGIRPLGKTLVADLLALGYPHDKPEGLVVLGPDEIGIVNDDDFGVTDGEGGPVAKRLPGDGRRDRVTLWTVRLSAPLR
ncbi:MAG: esterase-like activity of phytase family protein [Gemmatimonadales bacterium]